MKGATEIEQFVNAGMAAQTAVDEMGHGAPAERAGKTREHGPRVWPAQVLAMCAESLNCFSTLRACEREGCLVATEKERLEIAAELETLGRCAFALAEDFKKGGKR